MAIIKSSFAQIKEKDKLIRLLNNSPSSNGLETTLEDVVIEIDGNILKIKGKKWNWGFLFFKTFVEDMESKPISNHISLGYKTIWDFLRGIKKPYIKAGWFLYEKPIDYKAVMSEWYLSFS